ncbi:hypothetical protein A0257_12630 [Hymenobacter psoromatis]|nr:hypothetical protein A0257_12630 [Hymenobacter psoromatis]
MKKFSSVLLIDDDSTTNFLNNLLFKRLGVSDTLLVAENGALGLAVLQAACGEATPKCPALVLLDVNMPVMNGIEFLEAYQHLPLAQRQATIVVLLTTSVHPRDLERVRQLPIAGTLSKPLTEEKIWGVLQQYFPQ